jgi:Peptidase S24-like
MTDLEAQSHWLRTKAVTGVWLRAQGRSMWPLIRDGDEVWVRACTDIAKGQVLVGRIGTQWIAHLVERTAPLLTVSLSGRPDAPFEMVLGRVEKIRRGRREWPLPAPLGIVLRHVPKMGRKARANEWLRACWRVLRD